jgi:hypothetical protein
LLAAPLRLQVLPPSRGKRDGLINPECADLAEQVEEAPAKLAQRRRRDSSGRGLLLLLLDAEGDCPAELGPRLLEAAKKVRSDADISCVLAKRMLENWIVAGASTLAGVSDLPDSLPERDQFEDRSGAAWLDAQLRRRNPARKYKKTANAVAFVRAMNLPECRANSPSFDKLCRELASRISQQAQATGTGNDSAAPATDAGTVP